MIDVQGTLIDARDLRESTMLMHLQRPMRANNMVVVALALSWVIMITGGFCYIHIQGTMAFSPSYARSASNPSSLVANRYNKGDMIIRDGKNDIFSRRILHGRHRTDNICAAVSNSQHVEEEDIVKVDTSENQLLKVPVGNTDGNNDVNRPSDITAMQTSTPATVFDEVVNARYACTRFQRYQEPQTEQQNDDNTNSSDNNKSIPSTITQPTASISNPTIVHKANECLALSQRAPTGFNAQPYRVILVHSKEYKEKLAQYCLGRNADRVRDSDCTAVFLADQQVGRDGKRFTNFLMKNMDNDESSSSSITTISTESNNDGDNSPKTTSTPAKATSRTRRPLTSKALLKLRMFILLFSSGYPLPRFLSVPISFGIRAGVSIISFITRRLHIIKQSCQRLSKLLPKNIQLLPTLSSATTWSQKNTMLVAMTYMLACTSRNLATCPMEGFDANGIRRVLGIPRGRFSIPLIVSAGIPYKRGGNISDGEEEETDDVGVSHGSEDMSPRYPLEEVVYENTYGMPFVTT